MGGLEAVRVHMTWRLYQLYTAVQGWGGGGGEFNSQSATDKIIYLLGYFLNELVIIYFSPLVITLLRVKTDQIVVLTFCGLWLQSLILGNFTFGCIVATDLPILSFRLSYFWFRKNILPYPSFTWVEFLLLFLQ